MTVTAEPGGQAVGRLAAGVDAGVFRRLAVVGERQQHGLLGSGPAACRVRLGNVDLGGLVSGADHRERATLDLRPR